MDKDQLFAYKVAIVLAVSILIFFIVSFYRSKTQQPEDPGSLSESEALAIAEKNCIKENESLASGYYITDTRIWQFDAIVNEAREGCNPVCAVSEETKTAEISWRCVDFSTPKKSAEPLQKLFAIKYPQYAKTAQVKVEKETEDYARGSVSFESGGPGGIFLAAKINGAWQIVFDGNGQISCDLSRYGFPAEMLADCAEE